MKQRANLRSPLFLQYASRVAEAESTNLVDESEDFTTWIKTNSTIANGQQSPDNLDAAYLMSKNSTGSSSVLNIISKTSSAIDVTLSVFAKKDDIPYINLRLQGNYPNRCEAQFDLETGESTLESNFSTSVVLLDSNSEYYGNGWYRFSLKGTTDAASTFRFYIGLKNDQGEAYDLTDSVSGGSAYLFGAQAELGDLSSYIKTEGSTVVRAATTAVQELDVLSNILIWSGNYETPPTVSTFVLNKTPLNGIATIEVSDLVSDYIDQSTELDSGTVWLRVTMNDSLQLPRTHDFLCTEGYISSYESIQSNSTAPSSEIFMQSNDTVLIPDNESLNVPVYAESDSYYTTTTNGVESSSVTFGSGTSNGDQIKYISVTSDYDNVKLYVNSTLTSTVNVSVTECSKYDNISLMFVNKFGAKQEFFVNMKSVESLKIKDNGFNRNVINYSTLSIDNGIHGYKRNVSESRESFRLNTPFLDEGNVQAFEELLLSEYVWMKKGASDYTPVTVKENSTRKTHINDKLIQYTVSVESSFNLINNQR